jgi:hypothetical protein
MARSNSWRWLTLESAGPWVNKFPADGLNILSYTHQTEKSSKIPAKCFANNRVTQSTQNLHLPHRAPLPMDGINTCAKPCSAAIPFFHSDSQMHSLAPARRSGSLAHFFPGTSLAPVEPSPALAGLNSTGSLAKAGFHHSFVSRLRPQPSREAADRRARPGELPNRVYVHKVADVLFSFCRQRAAHLRRRTFQFTGIFACGFNFEVFTHKALIINVL